MSKIAFIDSGTGGLMFLCDFIKNLDDNLKKNFKFIHIGDNANVPYGLKTNEQLIVLTKNLINKAIEFECKVIIVACNTASTVLTQEIIDEYLDKGIIVIPIIKKSAEFLYQKAIERAKTNAIDLAIFATHQTVASNQYKIEIEKINNNKFPIKVHQYNPHDIEFKVEEDLKDIDIDSMIDNIILEFKQKIGQEAFLNISGIGLFCTHYPILKKKFHYYFQKHLGNKINEDIFCSQGQIFIESAIQHIDSNQFEESFNLIESYWTAKIDKVPKNIINSIIPDGYNVIFNQIS